MRKIFLHTLLVLLIATTSGAQQKYWIYFKDKTAEPSHKADYFDLPVNPVYIDSLYKLHYTVVAKSKWLNAVSTIIDEQDLPAICQLEFVEKIIPVNRHIRVMSSFGGTPDMQQALKQIHADTLLSLGLTGAGIKVGIIDGGFLNADKAPELQPLLDHKKLIAYRNFIETDVDDPFAGSKKWDDDHGTEVWKIIAGSDKTHDHYQGLATGAEFYLARTDQGDREHHAEEDYWIAALEWMYDNGVKLVNSSLGYSTGFDNPKDDYSPEQVDGKSSAITQAARIAAEEKGMILVIAAGNDGGTDFGVVSIPADAPGILSVGATAYHHWTKQSYSSTGPEQLGYIKPEVSCYSLHGTSFSAPVIAGVIACLLEAYPDEASSDMVEVVKRSGHLYAHPNNFLGYGVPDVRTMVKLLEHPQATIAHEEISATSDSVELRVDTDNVVIFYKKDEINVITQRAVKPRKGTITVKREDNAEYTTVATPGKVYEIRWE